MKLNRRSALTLAAAATLDLNWPEALGAAPPIPPASEHPRLWYRQPARMWLEALPIGNGRLGGMVWGKPRDELVQLNLDSWWAGRPYHPVNPAAREAVPRVRQLVLDGRIAEAHQLADAALIARPATQMPYFTAGSLLVQLSNVNDNDAELYERELDLDAALASTGFTAGGRRYVREVFASAVDGVIVVRLACNRAGLIDARLAWRANDGSAGAAEILPEEAGAADELLAVQRGRGAAGVDGGLTLASGAKVLARGGRVTRDGDALAVRGADEVLVLVLVLVALASDHRRFNLIGGDPVATARQLLRAAARKPYSALLADHQADHRRLFRAASLDLGRSPAAELSTDARLAISRPADDPALAALYFAYARAS